MSIVQTLGQSQFQDLLRDDEYANWSYDATEALFNYYDEISESMDEPFEFDRVAIRCNWNEYDDITEALDDYGKDDIDDLRDNTTVIELDNGHVLVEAF